MNDTAEFEKTRAHLLGIAYRMLGEWAAAEDVVQEAWIRWRAAEDVRDAYAWLSTVTVRLSLDALRAVRSRRENYVGPWLPEPIVPDDMRILETPDARAELASDLSLALLHVLERLSPEERAAFILHDAFDCEYEDIAAMLGKTEPATRKLVSRARERVKADRPRHTVSREQHSTLLVRFMQAVGSNDPAQLAEILAPDVIFYSDGGGLRPAALLPIYGPEKVNRLIFGLMEKSNVFTAPEYNFIEINGRPGFLVIGDGEIQTAITLESDGEKITAIYAMRNPEKLGRIARTMQKTNCHPGRA